MKTLLALLLVVSAASLSADYMSNCEALIGEWEACGSSSEKCSSIEEQITAECKCHVKKNGSWQLVHANIMGAGESNVCGFVAKDIPPPPPHKPPGRPIDYPPQQDPDKGDVN